MVTDCPKTTRIALELGNWDYLITLHLHVQACNHGARNAVRQTGGRSLTPTYPCRIFHFESMDRNILPEWAFSKKKSEVC